MTMKILYILHTTNPHDGATKAFLFMLDGLIKKGYKAIVAMPSADGIYHLLKERDIEVFATMFKPNSYPKCRNAKEAMLFLPRLIARRWLIKKSVHRIWKFTRSKQIDIVHTNTSIIDVGFRTAKLLGVPHIYHIREYADLIGVTYFPYKNSFYRQLNAPRSYNICITRNIQEYYLQTGKASSRVIYDGLISCDTPALPTIPKCDFFLFAGRLQTVKGLHQLLEAYRIYAQRSTSPLPLYVAGEHTDKQYSAEMIQFVAYHQLSKHVRFMGQRSDLPQLMQQARALIVPSTFEGFGFCMVEAMVNGCLVIGRNTSGTREQMENGRTTEGKDIALSYDTTEQLAERLTEVECNPPAHFTEYTTAAHHAVYSLYTIEQHVEQVAKLYETIKSKK